MARLSYVGALALTAGLAVAVPALTTSAAGASVLSSPRTGDTSVVVVELTPKQGKLAELLQAQIAKADSLGRTPFIEIGAEWCGQCHELKAALSDKRMIDAFSGTYIVRLDLDAWKDALAGLGYEIKAVPVFFAVDSAGKATGVSFTTDPFGANTPENVAAPLKKFFSEHLKKKTS